MKKLVKITMVMILLITFIAQSALAANIKLGHANAGQSQKSELPGGGANSKPAYTKNLIRVSFVNTSPHTMKVDVFNVKSDFSYYHWLDENGRSQGNNLSKEIQPGRTLILEMEIKKFIRGYAFNYTYSVNTADGRSSRHEARFINSSKSNYSTGSRMTDGWNDAFSNSTLSMSPCYYVGTVTTSTSDTISKMFAEWMGVKPNQKIYSKVLKTIAEQIVKLSKIPGTNETCTNYTACFGETKKDYSDIIWVDGQPMAKSGSHQNASVSKIRLK